MNYHDMPIYFIRHNIDEHKDIVSELEEGDKIAIHVVTDKEKKDWERFLKKDKLKEQLIQRWNSLSNEVKKNDVIVIAQYDPQRCKIGIIKKKSNWYELQKNIDFKMFQMTDTKVINYMDYMLLPVMLPQITTLSPIKTSRNYVLFAYGKEELNYCLDNLHYRMQEQMCVEWLRSELCLDGYRMKYQLLQTGHNMRDIDIYGVTYDGRKIYAQVTYYEKGLDKKIQKLKQYTKDNNIVIMFSNAEPDINDNIIFWPLSCVWSELWESIYQTMLREMIGGC